MAYAISIILAVDRRSCC